MKLIFEIEVDADRFRNCDAAYRDAILHELTDGCAVAQYLAVKTGQDEIRIVMLPR